MHYELREEENWIDYHLDLKISDKEKTYTSSGEASLSPIASKIFGFPWVEEVFVGNQRVSIKRQDWVDFEIIAEPLKELLEEHFKNKESGEIEENPEISIVKDEAPANTSDLSKESQMIVSFLDQQVNPQVASHGGRISLLKFEKGTLYLKMEGGCQGCGMAQVTLREGVETALKENFSFVKEVVDATDHSQGLNPFIKG
jgi:Fe-S cluster biogenesis protein NfuA